jgi:four helix bundle protein
MEIQSFQDLQVWQKAMLLAEQVYRLTRGFPREELFGLTSQMRRAATSIPANIAEGWGRRGTKEFLQFLNIAAGSLRELETYILLAQRVELATPAKAQPILELLHVLSKQLVNLQRSLKKR